MNKLNKVQKKAMQAMNAGDNIVLTGPGWIGKLVVYTTDTVGDFRESDYPTEKELFFNLATQCAVPR